MEIQQSGYRFSRAILSRIPKPLFLLAILLVLALMAGDSILAISSKPQVAMDECLVQYYDLTHSNISTFLANNTSTPLPSSSELNRIIKYLNESRIVEIHSGQVPSGKQCQIELNYQPANNSQTLAYLVSNYPLFNVNRTDFEFRRKHGIIVDKIIIPQSNPGSRYFGANLFVSQVEDFMFALARDFIIFEQRFTQKLNSYSQQIDQQIKELFKLAKSDNKSVVNESTNAGDQEKKGIDRETTKQDDKIKLQKSSSIPLMNKINNRRLEQESEQKEKSGEENITNVTEAMQMLKAQKILLMNVISHLLLQSTSGKHKIFYSFDRQQWHGVVLPTLSSPTKSYSLWNLLGKLFSLCFLAFYVIACFYLIAIAVRYGFILTILLFTTLGSSCLPRVGWMDRFLGMYRGKIVNGHSRLKNPKISVQIILSFLGMYGMLAIIGYLLSEAAASVFTVTRVIPDHPFYTDSLIATFYMVEICHYIFLRSRVSLQFFNKFSLLSTLFVLMITSQYPFLYNSLLLHFMFLLNLLLILCFLFLEKCVYEEDYESGYKPSVDKPRMLFYLGYDLDWHRGLPPIWTMFQPWFDLSYASEQERCYIDQNYELLYGRLMGVNQSQQIPDEPDQMEESQNFGPRAMLENSDGPGRE